MALTIQHPSIPNEYKQILFDNQILTTFQYINNDGGEGWRLCCIEFCNDIRYIDYGYHCSSNDIMDIIEFNILLLKYYIQSKYIDQETVYLKFKHFDKNNYKKYTIIHPYLSTYKNKYRQFCNIFHIDYNPLYECIIGIERYIDYLDIMLFTVVSLDCLELEHALFLNDMFEPYLFSFTCVVYEQYNPPNNYLYRNPTKPISLYTIIKIYKNIIRFIQTTYHLYNRDYNDMILDLKSMYSHIGYTIVWNYNKEYYKHIVLCFWCFSDSLFDFIKHVNNQYSLYIDTNAILDMFYNKIS